MLNFSRTLVMKHQILQADSWLLSFQGGQNLIDTVQKIPIERKIFENRAERQKVRESGGRILTPSVTSINHEEDGREVTIMTG